MLSDALKQRYEWLRNVPARTAMLESYPPALHKSWVATELHGVRNVQPAVAHWGGTMGTLYAGLDMCPSAFPETRCSTMARSPMVPITKSRRAAISRNAAGASCSTPMTRLIATICARGLRAR